MSEAIEKYLLVGIGFYLGVAIVRRHTFKKTNELIKELDSKL